ncbi:MAG: sugar ABC transporter permease, partial [Oscillospiraceae bacterium]
GIIALLAFSYIPMTGIVLAFKEYNFRDGIYFSPWAEPFFKNFLFFFNNAEIAWRATRNTVMYNILFFVFGTFFSVIIAIMLNELKNKRFVKVTQSVMFFPYFISWMVMGSILNAILNKGTGFLTKLIETTTGQTIDFYATSWYWIIILVIISVWQGTGYTSIIYYGVITGLDTSMY